MKIFCNDILKACWICFVQLVFNYSMERLLDRCVLLPQGSFARQLS